MKLFKLKNKENQFKCNCCGKIYDNIPLTFGNDYPAFYNSIPKNEIKNRIEYQKSLCVIDEKYFFHRVRLEIPILDYSENLNFDIWTTISEDNFIKRNDDWNNPERINNEPYFGRLENEIPTYSDTFHLETTSRESEIGLIPKLEIIDKNHPLYLDQQNGITLEKAQKIVQQILEKQHKRIESGQNLKGFTLKGFTKALVTEINRFVEKFR